MTTDNRDQIAKQCDAIVHMADAIARVHTDFADMLRLGHLGSTLEFTGQRTARLMETLGDILNGMDAVDETDDWMKPVFAEAHRLWPAQTEG